MPQKGVFFRLYDEMDEKTFEKRVISLRNRAITTCKACGADSMLADDVAQEVLIKLWQMRDSLEQYRSLDCLVAVIARHELANHYRNKRTVALNGIEVGKLQSSFGEPDQNLISSQEMSWLNKTMHQLPSTQYAVLYMRQVEQRSYEEIAQLLGIEDSSARSLLSRARMWLLQEIKKRDYQ